MTEQTSQRTEAQSAFRRTLIQVLVVQVVALALLGLLQIGYHVS